MKNVIHAFGVLESPLQVSETLRKLRVGYVVVDGTLKARTRTIEASARQPAWPVVMPSVDALRRFQCDKERQVLLICDSLSALTAANVRIIRPANLDVAIERALRYAVQNVFDPKWSIAKQEPSIEEYIDKATKPSFLNNVQTEVYKIVPYDLRKEVQKLVIGYLAGIESRKKLMEKLNSSFKLDRVKALIKSPKCMELREAVALYRKNGSEDETAAATGFESFEILYLVRSSGKVQ